MAVIALDALNQAFKSNVRKMSTDLPDVGQLLEVDLFHNFVCRLGQICDSRKGGSTVTRGTALPVLIDLSVPALADEL